MIFRSKKDERLSSWNVPLLTLTAQQEFDASSCICVQVLFHIYGILLGNLGHTWYATDSHGLWCWRLSWNQCTTWSDFAQTALHLKRTHVPIGLALVLPLAKRPLPCWLRWQDQLGAVGTFLCFLWSSEDQALWCQSPYCPYWVLAALPQDHLVRFLLGFHVTTLCFLYVNLLFNALLDLCFLGFSLCIFSPIHLWCACLYPLHPCCIAEGFQFW